MNPALDLPSLELAAIRELASIDQWVCWKLVDGRKIPKQPSGLNASSTNPDTWRRFDECAQAVVSKGMTGLGFVFSAEDDLVGIDFDHVLDEAGGFKDPAIEAIVRGLDSYTERSPSGDGLHVWLRGAIPGAIKIEPIEIYDRGRYFTVTGQHVPGFRETIEWREAEIAKLCADLRGSKEGSTAPPPARGSVKAGSRNNTLTTEAGRLVRAGFREDRLLAALRGLNQGICDPALPDGEVEAIVRSAGAWEGPREAHPDPQERRPYPLIAFGDIHPGLEEDYLVKGVIARGSLAALIGAPGSSKTFVALELSLSTASNTPWRGLRTRRGRVVYVAAEGAAGLRNRLTASRRRLALGNPSSVQFHLVPDVVRLVDDADDIDRLVTTIREQIPDGGVDLIVIDTLSRAIAGRDENSAQDMTTAVDQADRLRREFGCAVLLVHHSGKDESRGARGHSSLRAALDTELEVRKLGETFALTLSKAREHETGRVWHHRLELVEIGVDPDGDPISSCIVRPLSDNDDIENGSKPHLNANEERTLTALRALLAVADGTSLTAPDSAPKDALRDWVERHAGVSHALRRNVVLKGLKGLKAKGIVEIERDRVFLVRDDLT